MTTMTEVEVRCAVCATLGRKAVLSSTSSFGPPDLDLRPQGPARWAIEFSVQRCDSCGYCADSIGQAPVGARAIIDSPVYRKVLAASRGCPGSPARSLRSARRRGCEPARGGRLAVPRGSLGVRRQERSDASGDLPRTGSRDVRKGARARRGDRAAAVVLTLTADVWRRAGRFEEAIAAATQAEA